MGVQLGDFILEKRIGAGGMGQVYLGRQVSLDRKVAVKVMPKSMSSNPSAIKRFEREAKSAANLVNPNVVQIYHFGVERDVPYFAMEFVEGKDLDVMIKEGHKFSVEETIEIMTGVLKALAAASRQNLVHRDIKPGNIMISSDDVVKVMDFGLAKVAEMQDQTITQAGMIIGTPHYMSPEQGKGEELDTRSDIYSLGVVWYQLLTGELPFKADTPTAMIYQHAYEQPLPPRSINPEIPEGVEQMVLKMMEKDPANRYQKPKETLEDLNYFRMGTLTPGAFTPSSTPPSSVHSDVTMPISQADIRREGRSRAPMIIGLALLAVLVVGALGVFLFWADLFGTPEIVKPDNTGTAVSTGNSAGATTGQKTSEGTITADKGEKTAILPLSELEDLLSDDVRVEMKEPGRTESIVVDFHDVRKQWGPYNFKFSRGKGYLPITHVVSLDNNGVSPPFSELDLSFVPRGELKDPYDEGERNYIEAETHFKGDRMKEALTAYKQALSSFEIAAQLDPEYRNLPKRIPDCKAKIKAIETETTRDKKIYDQAQAMFTGQDYEEAIKKLDTIPDRSAYAAQKKALMGRADDKIKQIRTNLGDAERYIKTGEFDKAWTSLERVFADQRDNREAEELSKKRDMAKKMAAAGFEAFAKQDYETAKAELKNLLEISPDFEKAKTDFDIASRKVAEEQARLSRIEELLSAAEVDFRNGKYEDAIKRTSEILDKLEKGHAEAERLKRKAVEARDRRDINALITKLDQAFRNKDADALFGLIAPEAENLAKFKNDFADLKKDPVQIRKCEHKITEIKLDEGKAVVECAMTLEIHDPESMVTKSVTPAGRRIKLTRKQNRWLISSYQTVN